MYEFFFLIMVISESRVCVIECMIKFSHYRPLEINRARIVISQKGVSFVIVLVNHV